MYISRYFVRLLKSLLEIGYFFSLLLLLIVFCECVVTFLSLVFLLLYTVPCSRATSLSMNCELRKLNRKLRKRDRFIKTVPASIY